MTFGFKVCLGVGGGGLGVYSLAFGSWNQWEIMLLDAAIVCKLLTVHYSSDKERPLHNFLR